MYYLAQADAGYGCANYGQTDSYNSCTVINGSELSNTGTPLLVPMLTGLFIVVVAVVLLLKTKKK